MADNYRVGITIGATLASGYRKAVGVARQDMGTLGQSIKDLSAQRGLIERFERDRAALEKARLDFSRAQKEVMRLKLALKKGTGDATARDLEKAQQQAGRLNQRLEQTRERVNRTERAMQSAGLEVGDYANQYTRLGQTLDQTRAKYERLEARMAKKSAAGQRLADMRGKMLGAAGAVYATSRMVGAAADFQYEKAFLSTVINAKNVDAAVDAAGRHALAYARKNLTSESEMLDIKYALNSAGLDAAAARAGSEIVAKVKTITRGSAGQVGEVVATVFNNLGASLEGNTEERLERIGELLTRTQFKFQIRDFGQLGESMKYASPILKQFNVDLAQGVSVIGALNSAGLQGSQAGTAFGATMRNMSKASQEFGFELARNASGGIDLVKTMQNLDAAVGGLADMDQATNDALQKVFGAEGIRMVALLGSELDKLAAAQQDVTESSKGIIDKSYGRFLNTTRGQLTLLTNNVRILGTVFAGTLLPGVNAVLRPVTAFAGWVGSLIERMPWLGKVIGGAAVGVGALAAAIAVGTAATWAWNAALLASPLGWIGLAVAGAVGVIMAFWEPIVGFFEGVWAGIKKVFKVGVDYLQTVWENSPLGRVFKAGNKLASLVGKFVGGGSEKVRKIGRAAAAAGVGASLAVTPAAGANADMAARVDDLQPAVMASAGKNETKIEAPITVNAAPGMDEAEVGRQVKQALEQREAEAEAKKRGALHD